MAQSNGVYQKSYSAAFNLNFGDTSIQLLAQKETNETGWHFEGHSGEGQQIPIGNLITELASKFDGDATVPAELNGWTLQDVHVSYHTHEQKLFAGLRR